MFMGGDQSLPTRSQQACSLPNVDSLDTVHLSHQAPVRNLALRVYIKRVVVEGDFVAYVCLCVSLLLCTLVVPDGLGRFPRISQPGSRWSGDRYVIGARILDLSFVFSGPESTLDTFQYHLDLACRFHQRVCTMSVVSPSIPMVTVPRLSKQKELA